MKVHVLYDKSGNIISAGYLDRPTPETYDHMAPRFGPEAREGQQVAELELPDDYIKLGPSDLIQRLQGDLQAKLGGKGR
jgi:hypothetical protein